MPDRPVTRGRMIAIGVVLVVVVAVLAWVYRSGGRAGADHVTAKVGRDHGAAVADARADERRGATSTATIAARTARADDMTDRLVRQSIKELRDAITDVPPAVAGDPLPPAPVDGLHDRLNASIARADRAAEPASAAE
ncbi:MAG: hypothetical protein ACK4TC_04830 [Sphingomonas pseudosanguinis]|uniref:hypothetical protein n=1 Tax=Sphingomonas pseudosanguinis TaxID=413712 RepID=UPI0039199D8C